MSLRVDYSQLSHDINSETIQDCTDISVFRWASNRWGILFELINKFVCLSARMQSIPNDCSRWLGVHPSKGDPPKDTVLLYL